MDNLVGRQQIVQLRTDLELQLETSKDMAVRELLWDLICRITDSLENWSKNNV